MAKETAKKRRVHFSPDNVEIIVDEGENLLDVAIAAGVHISASCGGQGTCGTCKVLIEKGQVETRRMPRLSDEDFEQGIRQACQSRILTDLSVYVPVESRLERAVVAREKKEAPGALATGWRFSPPISKFYVELPSPTMEDNVSDLSRLLRGLKQRYQLSNITVDFEVVKKLAQVLREGNWKVTVTTLVTAAKTRTRDRRRLALIDIEPGDTRDKHYSLAIDIGTTTIWGHLLDLNRGRVLAQHVEFNGQISYGADVITRIAYTQKQGGLKKLQKVVVATINEVIDELLAKSKVSRNDVGHIIAAGNTVMTQILLGLDPQYIRLAPYTPVANFFPPVEANSLGINVKNRVYLFAFPAVASYVGGDIVSGIVGSGVHQRKELTLYIDIGTNGEIVIGNSDWMVTAACSAGPAFEGGGIKHGMVAIAGAIEQFEINPKTYEPTISTIEGEKPKGICGTGLMNTVAALLEARVITPNGKFNTDLPTKRVRQGEGRYEYVLAWAQETQIGKDIVLTEPDIDNLMRAKAAMYAGCQTLARSVGINISDVERIILAGAFGSNLDAEKSITIGLLPDIPIEKITFIGNGSLLGARLTSFSTDIMDDARRVAEMMTSIELSDNVDFMNNYIAALFLPHTNISEFPSVAKRLAGKTESKQRRVAG